MLRKTGFARLLIFISLFVFKAGPMPALPYEGQVMASAQLDSIIHITYLRHRSHPKDVLLIRQLAESYTAKQNIDSALHYWSALTDIQPKNDTAYFKQAMLLYAQGKFEGAYAAISLSQTVNPEKVDYLALSAITAYHLQQEDTALALCAKILKTDPQNINALLLSGIIMRNQKHNEDALVQFDNCLRADPANTEALVHRAEIEVLLKQYNNALRDYSAARSDFSSNPDIINDLGICYYQSGSYQKAINFFRKAIFINKQHPQGNFNRGLAYYNLNDFDSASTDIKAASAIWDTCYNDTCHANFLDAIYYLGMCYKKIGDLSAAKNHFELLQKENYPRDLTAEIRNINYALFISRNWYYIAAVFVLFIALIVAVFKTVMRR